MHSPTGLYNQDGKVLRIQIGKLSADRERSERNADNAKRKGDAKEERGKGGELNIRRGCQR